MTVDSHERFLVIFFVGGIRFAAEASKVYEIDGANGKSNDKVSKPSVVDLASLLHLPKQKGTRILTVESPLGKMGFLVDAVAKEDIASWVVLPVPDLLWNWMEPKAVSGFAIQEQKIVSILNLQRLAELALQTASNFQNV